jgi:hypothetical protein
MGRQEISREQGEAQQQPDLEVLKRPKTTQARK